MSLLNNKQKHNTSSTNNICDIDRSLPKPMPKRSLLLLESICAMLNPLGTSKNRLGDKGKPCCSPLVALNKPKANPLMRNTKFDEVTHTIIQCTSKSVKSR